MYSRADFGITQTAVSFVTFERGLLLVTYCLPTIRRGYMSSILHMVSYYLSDTRSAACVKCEPQQWASRYCALKLPFEW